MIPLKLKRRHLRAPLANKCIFIDEGTCFKGRVWNISEGGILLGGVGIFPTSKQFSVFFDLPLLPDFSLLSTSEIFSLSSESFDHSVYGAQVEVRRSFEHNFERLETGEDSSLNKNTGCEFVHLSNEAQRAIKKYVANFSVNIVYVLSLFEQGYHRKEVSDLIRKSISLLNYDENLKLSQSRQIVLHDYQSLESL